MEVLEGTLISKDFLNKKYGVRYSNGKVFKVDYDRLRKMDEPHKLGAQKISLKDLPLPKGEGCE